MVQVLEPPIQTLQPRPARLQAAFPVGVGAVRLGDHVGRAALEQRQALHLRGDPRDELDGAGSGADHRDPLAGQLDLGVPVRRVERRTLEALQAGQARQQRPAQLAGGADQGPCAQRLAIGAAHLPFAAAGVEMGLLHLAVETDLLAQTVLVRAMPQVVEDFRLRGELARPVGLRLEGKRIEMRGVAVFPPATADIGGLFQDQIIVDACLSQADRQAETGEAGANHQQPQGGFRAGLVVHCCAPVCCLPRRPARFRPAADGSILVRRGDWRYGRAGHKVVIFGQPRTPPCPLRPGLPAAAPSARTC